MKEKLQWIFIYVLLGACVLAGLVGITSGTSDTLVVLSIDNRSRSPITVKEADVSVGEFEIGGGERVPAGGHADYDLGWYSPRTGYTINIFAVRPGLPTLQLKVSERELSRVKMHGVVKVTVTDEAITIGSPDQ